MLSRKSRSAAQAQANDRGQTKALVVSSAVVPRRTARGDFVALGSNE